MNHTEARRQFSRVGFACFAVTFVTYAVLLVAQPLLLSRWPGLLNHPWYVWASSSLPLYLCGFPCAALILRKCKKQATPKRDLPLPWFAAAFAVGYTLLLAGNILGNLLMSVVQAISGLESGNLVADVLADSDLLGVLIFAVVLAPLMEEWLFRGLIYDRLAVFGPGWATALSALLFGLFHGNFYQLFYAVSVGLVLGWLKARTGRLIWGIALHMGINFMGSVVPLWMMDVSLDADSLAAMTPQALAVLVYSTFLLWLTAVGTLVLVKHRKTVLRVLAVDAGPDLWKQVVKAPGMWCVLALSLVLFLASILI